MRVAVICHTESMRLMCHAWRQGGDTILEAYLPAVHLARNPTLRLEAARRLVRQIKAYQPDFVVDVNAAGLLPLEAGLLAWTVDEVAAPWCVWWWDAPHVSVQSPYYQYEQPALWRAALQRPQIRQFMWDAVLAREYTRWFERPVAWLPTATHTGVLQPAAARHAARTFPPVAISFLGEYYQPPGAPDAALQQMADCRCRQPALTYFEILAAEYPAYESIRPLFDTTGNATAGAFAAELLAFKSQADRLTGYLRRCAALDALQQNNIRCLFVGRNYPPPWQVHEPPITTVHDLAACYQAATLNLDPGNGQSFTGTALRAYEIMAAGGVLACRAHPDFDPDGHLHGVAYLGYSSIEELLQWCKETALNSPRVKSLRENARQYAAAQHDWQHRLAALAQQVAHPAAAPTQPEKTRGVELETAPLVSVIIPTCNRPDSLQAAIASVARQQYPRLEIIVINDAGPEVETVVQTAAAGRPCRYVRLPMRVGTGAARNVGLRMAQGDFVAYLDDDDLYYEDHLSTLAGRLQANPALVAVYGQAMEVQLVQQNGALQTLSRQVKYKEPFNRGRLLLGNYIPNLCLLHRRAALIKSGPFDERLTALEDWDFHIRLALIGDFEFVPQTTSEYVVRMNSAHRNQWNQDRIRTIRLILDRYARFGTPALRELQRKFWPACFPEDGAPTKEPVCAG